MSGSGGRGYKKYGGRDRSSAGNIVSHSVSNGGRVIVTNSSGSNNSKTVTQSHLDMSNNSLLNVECIYFSDGTVQCTAGGTGGGGGGTGYTGYTGTTGLTGPTGIGSTGSTGHHSIGKYHSNRKHFCKRKHQPW